MVAPKIQCSRHSFVHRYFSRAHHGWAREKLLDLGSQDVWKTLFSEHIDHVQYRNMGAISLVFETELTVGTI